MTSHDAAGNRRRAPRSVLRLALATAFVLVSSLAGTAAAAAAPPTAANSPSWTLPASGSLLAAFDRNDYNEQDGAPEQVAAPDDPSRQAIQFSLDGGAQRTELKPRLPDQHEGQVQYYSYNALLAPDFPTDVNTWQLILQWHQYGDSGSPPVAIEVRGDRLMLASEGTDLQDLGPIGPGDRVDLSMRIAFSRDPGQGTVDVWRGADHVLSGYHPPSGTMLDDGNYMKFGIYRDTAIDQPARLWVEDFRVGTSLASVVSPVSAAGATPVEGAPVTSPAPASSSSPDTMIWIAGGLLVLVVLVVAGRLRRRATH